MPRKPKQYGIMACVVIDPMRYKGKPCGGLLTYDAARVEIDFIADLLARLEIYGSYKLVEYDADGEPTIVDGRVLATSRGAYAAIREKRD